MDKGEKAERNGELAFTKYLLHQINCPKLPYLFTAAQSPLWALDSILSIVEMRRNQAKATHHTVKSGLVTKSPTLVTMTDSMPC